MNGVSEFTVRQRKPVPVVLGQVLQSAFLLSRWLSEHCLTEAQRPAAEPHTHRHAAHTLATSTGQRRVQSSAWKRPSLSNRLMGFLNTPTRLRKDVFICHYLWDTATATLQV